MTNTEMWTRIEKYPIYEVSSYGRVRRPINGGYNHKTQNYMLTPSLSSQGYQKVNLVFEGKLKCGLVHRMVAASFIGPRPLGYEVNHKDGDKLNNHISNLEYVTHLQNMQHASLYGLYRRGEAHRDAKLTAQDVKAIREFYVPRRRGRGPRVIARLYGVSTATISCLLNGKTWKHV